MKNHPAGSAASVCFVLALGLSIAACSRPDNPGGDTVATATTVGTDIDDSVITTNIKSALLGDPDVKSFDFKVETHKGEVQLSGFVQNSAQLERASEISRAVKGVKGVQNKVTMKGAATSVGTGVDDSIVTARVRAALFSDALVKSADIAIATRKGEVQLSGFVDNQAQIDRALEVARGVQNVAIVTNEMSVKR